MAKTMARKNPRVHRETLPSRLADALLNVPLDATTAEDTPAGSLADRLFRAKTELTSAVEAANKELQRNPLSEILAEHAQRLSGKRGHPRIIVDPDGSVMLEVHYSQPPEQKVEKRRSSLPPIVDLRREAEQLGLDWQQFGKGKRALIKALEGARGGATPTPPTGLAPPKPPAPKPVSKQDPVPKAIPQKKVAPAKPAAKPKRTRTAPAVQAKPVRLTPDNRHVIPLDDDEDDLDVLFGRKPEPTPEVTTPEVTPEVTKPKAAKPKKPAPRRGPQNAAMKPLGGIPGMGGMNLASIVSKADDVDIDAILAKDEPKMPTDEDEDGPPAD